MKHKLVVLAVVVVGALPASAQSSSRTCTADGVAVACAERVTVIDVGEDVIEAAPARPSASSTTSLPRPKYRSLIRLRTDFRAQVLSSVSAL